MKSKASAEESFALWLWKSGKPKPTIDRSIELFNVKTQFLAIAVDDKGQVGVLKKGPSVFKPIMDLIEAGYTLSETPIIISRKGTGLDTEYSVIPTKGKDAPLTEEEQQAVADFQQSYDLNQRSQPMSYENIERKMKGEDLIFDDQKAEDTLTLPD